LKGDLNGAIADYNRAIELDPKYTGAYTGRGNVKQRKGDFNGAIADHNRAIELNPKFALAYNNRGYVKQLKSDLGGALADYDRAIELDPKLALAYVNRGCANIVLRKWKAALEDFNRSFEVPNRDQDNAHIFAWLIRARLDETNAANADLSAFLNKRTNTLSGDWISTVAGYLLGKVSEADLFTAARSSDEKKEREQLCKAWFYTGAKKLLAGDKIAAGDRFTKCLATDQKTVTEYQFSQSELKALGR
jgi:lipoprotein NlpI